MSRNEKCAVFTITSRWSMKFFFEDSELKDRCVVMEKRLLVPGLPVT